MSKKRYVDTRFWDDEYIIELNRDEKLLFLYFLTNPLTNICGIYEISMRRICFDTSFNPEEAQPILDKFARDGKIFYLEGYIYIKNFAKHQQDNASIKKGIEKCMKEIPEKVLAKIREIDTGGHPTDTPRVTECGISESEFKSKSEKESKINPPVKKSLEQLFSEKVANIPSELMGEKEKFMDYWTEKGERDKKEYWETKKKFDVSRRWQRWLRNSKEFKRGPNLTDAQIREDDRKQREQQEKEWEDRERARKETMNLTPEQRAERQKKIDDIKKNLIDKKSFG